MACREVRWREVALEVDADHRVELVLGHVEAHLVAQDPRVADEHVEATEQLDRLVHHALGAGPARAVVVVGDSVTAGRGDLVDNLLRGGLVGAFTGARSTEVVDHDLRAFAREQERLGTADTPAGPGDDRDLAVEQTHRRLDSHLVGAANPHLCPGT